MGKYSETMMDHVMSPRNGGVMENPDLTGHVGTPGRGAFMILYLKVRDDQIIAAKYHTVGCGPTIAAGSALSELVMGRSIDACRELTTDHLIEALDGVPPTNCIARRWQSRPCKMPSAITNHGKSFNH